RQVGRSAVVKRRLANLLPRRRGSQVGTRLDGPQRELEALHLYDLPHACDGRRQLPVLRRAERVERLAPYYEAAPHPRLRPQACSRTAEEAERYVADPTSCERPTRPGCWHQTVARVTPDEVAIEVGQHAHGICRLRPGRRCLTRQQPGALALDLDL